MILATGRLGMISAHTPARSSTSGTGFEPTFDIAAAIADYVAWRAHNPR